MSGSTTPQTALPPVSRLRTIWRRRKGLYCWRFIRFFNKAAYSSLPRPALRPDGAESSCYQKKGAPTL